ncbi:hypothetical protein IAD21_04358 [Abditibacteriota bacterium]|nr:hypothetical protein IAD21_04358 [Abditibacteriota bacterium]
MIATLFFNARSATGCSQAGGKLAAGRTARTLALRPSRLLFLAYSLLTGFSLARAADKDVASPTFSFDAKKVAYCVVTLAGDDPQNKFKIKSSEIWTANRDGSGARRLTTGAIDGNIRWSPDGKQIAFRRSGDIWMVGTDGTGLKQLTKTSPTEESSPEFSNDSKILFYVRNTYINLAKFVPGADPILNAEPGVIVARSLVSGQETERFKSKDNVIQIMPNRADASEVFMLYKPYDPAAPLGGEDVVVAAAKLDGSGKRILKRQTQNSTSEIKGLYAGSGGAVIETEETIDEEKSQQFLIQSKGGDKIFNADALPLMVLNDISLDGNFFMGVGPVTKEVNGKLQIERSIKIYAPASKEFAGLDRSTLLNMTATPVVAPIPARPQPGPVTVQPRPLPQPAPITEQPVRRNAGPSAEAKVHYEEGNKNLAQGLTGIALDEYSEAIKLYPDYVEAYRGLAKCYAQRTEWDSAIENVSAAIRLTPNDSDAYFERADYNVIVGDYPAARADYSAAIRLAPKNPKLYRARAELLRKTGDTEQATADEQKAKELEG